MNWRNNLITVVSVDLKAHTIPFGRTTHLILLVFLLQVLVINVFLIPTVVRIPRPPLSDSYSCDLHWTNWYRRPVSLPHLMAQISVIRWTRSTLLHIAQCIMTDWLGEVRFNWNDSGTSRTRGSRLSQGLEVSRDGLVGERGRRKALSGKKGTA